MIDNLGRYFLGFIGIMAVQVLILNNLNLGGYINPWLYVLFILVLPLEMPNWLLMITGFFTGLIIDIFLNTPGMHASATVFLAFLRPALLRFFGPHDGYESGSLPLPSHLGFGWFFKYTALAVFAHHLFLSTIEAFSLGNFFFTLQKSIFSSLATLITIFIVILFTVKAERKY